VEATASRGKSFITGKELWNKRQRMPRVKQWTDSEGRKRPFGVTPVTLDMFVAQSFFKLQLICTEVLKQE